MTKPQEAPQGDAEKRAELIDELTRKERGRDSINTMLRLESMPELSAEEYEALRPKEKFIDAEPLPPTGKIDGRNGEEKEFAEE